MISPEVDRKILKQQLRRIMLQKRNEFDVRVKIEYDSKVCHALCEIANLNSISNVHCYLPFAGEIDIKPFIQFALNNGITVVIPKTLPKRELENRVLLSLKEDDIEVGIKNTLHPRNQEVFQGQYDLIVVPGLAFDSHCYRLGYGGGYYDSFLANQKEALKIGVFYPFQKVEIVPIEDHDVSLDQILYF